jgi:hypothetical protein
MDHRRQNKRRLVLSESLYSWQPGKKGASGICLGLKIEIFMLKGRKEAFSVEFDATAVGRGPFYFSR